MADLHEIKPRLLMGPGPSDVNPRVLEAMALPTIGHLDPQFLAILEEKRKHRTPNIQHRTLNVEGR